MAEPNNKFETEDLPRILAALKEAHEAKRKSKVEVLFAENGGVVGISVETKKAFK